MHPVPETKKDQKLMEHEELPPGKVVPAQVVAVPGMASGDEHPIGPLPEGLQNVQRVNTP